MVLETTLTVVQAWCDAAWEMVWGKLWYPGTKLFYDYIPNTGDIIADLPTLEEIAHSIPNPRGCKNNANSISVLRQNAGVLS